MNPFLTIYTKDYVKKTGMRPDKNGVLQEFKDPLNESYKNYLQLSCEEPPAEPPKEDADIYLKKHIEKYPKHGKLHFQTPVNNEVVKNAFVYNGRTVYQVDYCDLQKDLEYKEAERKRNMYRLPDDWDIPLTTQKYSYRNPLVINSRAMERTPPIAIPNNLDPDDNIREILKVTTGKTEYGGVIDKLGRIIMKNELHGKRTYL
ncbi:hypothetical protein ILUMI_22083 [Ignelater luminosus]|uniref:Uncharacterized protein n=1 Tax=Ignelater luminosus TaxID=2038154 RepID=A0A8K0FXK3_IGNLU|nr:hypothetical protein ILUMI_22083 [Ignelater luminosus]